MSRVSKVIESLIEQKLLGLHTAYFAKVISVYGSTAKIQPLNMVKAAGQNAKKQAVLTVPIMPTAHKHGQRTIYTEDTSFTVPTVESVSAGDIVLCLCGERDITETKKGKFVLPPLGHHRMSDSVIIGVI